MSGNSFGTLFCVSSFGESHGAAYGGGKASERIARVIAGFVSARRPAR